MRAANSSSRGRPVATRSRNTPARRSLAPTVAPTTVEATTPSTLRIRIHGRNSRCRPPDRCGPGAIPRRIAGRPKTRISMRPSWRRPSKTALGPSTASASPLVVERRVGSAVGHRPISHTPTEGPYRFAHDARLLLPHCPRRDAAASGACAQGGGPGRLDRADIERPTSHLVGARPPGRARGRAGRAEARARAPATGPGGRFIGAAEGDGHVTADHDRLRLLDDDDLMPRGAGRGDEAEPGEQLELAVDRS